jgi:hypothetical protein
MNCFPAKEIFTSIKKSNQGIVFVRFWLPNLITEDIQFTKINITLNNILGFWVKYSYLFRKIAPPELAP